MNTLLDDIRDRLIDAPVRVCLDRLRLATEAWRRHEGEPPPLRRAHTLAHILGNMALDVDSNRVFAGNTSTAPGAWMLLPEFGIGCDPQVLIENDGLEGLPGSQVPEDLQAFWAERSFGRTGGGFAGPGHLAVDMDRAVNEGLDAVIAEADSLRDAGDAGQQTYRRAMIIACRSVIDWAERYAEAAERAARAATGPLLQRAHTRVAEACRHVPARPARNLFEGLQAIALVHLALAIEGQGMSLSIGLPDRALARFADQAEDPEATDLVCALLLKVAGNSLYGRGSKTQAITVGGTDHTGRDCCNAVTFRFLEAFDRIRVADPHLFLRWHAGLDERARDRAAGMLARGVSMPLLINDAPTARGFIDAGVSDEDAWDYCVIGCNELGIPGRANRSAMPLGRVNCIEQLNAALLVGRPPQDMDELLARVRDGVDRAIGETISQREARRHETARRMPAPLASSLMAGCVAEGRDLLAGQKYELDATYERGLTNAVNALAAIEQRVFSEGALTMERLIDALRSDFADEGVRELLRSCPRWANDDPRADKWAAVLLDIRERVVRKAEARRGGRRLLPCHVVRSLHHLDGRRIGASPDGRHAGQPVADSIGPEDGLSPHGPTAALGSVLRIDAARYFPGGYNLNLTLPGSGMHSSAVRGLIEGFFADGGQELQVACLDAETLRDAREHPEAYRDLVVRIAGFNALFVKLSRAEQDELIARASAR